MRKITAILLTLLLVTLSLVGCGGANNNQGTKEEITKETTTKETNDPVSETVEDDHIKIEDLEWNVSNGIYNGIRMLVFDYTNNSKYTVVEFNIKFTLKDGVTNEQLAIFNEVKEEAELTDEEVKDLYIQGRNRKVSDPGEELKSSPCTISGTFKIITDVEQYNLMEPDMASIAYVKGDKVYSVYYDFKTSEYTENNNGGVKAFEWPTTEIAKRVPKPDLRIGQLTTSDEDSFFFTGYGTDEGFFEEYVSLCEKEGYVFETNIDGWMCEATNKEGYSLSLLYDKNTEQMTIQLDKVDE